MLQDVADRIGREAKLRHYHPRIMAMDAFPVTQLPQWELVVFVASTTGQVGSAAHGAVGVESVFHNDNDLVFAGRAAHQHEAVLALSAAQELAQHVVAAKPHRYLWPGRLRQAGISIPV